MLAHMFAICIEKENLGQISLQDSGSLLPHDITGLVTIYLRISSALCIAIWWMAYLGYNIHGDAGCDISGHGVNSFC